MSLDNAVQDGFNVDFAIANRTATAGQDFAATTGTLTFAGTVGETLTIEVPIIDDTVLESDETFDLDISNATKGVVIADGNGIGAVTDNDTASIRIDDVTVGEGDGTAVFTVTLDNAVQEGFSVSFTTADDTATSGQDFTATSGSLSFAGTVGETQTIEVAITDDTIFDPNETFTVTLSAPTSGVTLSDATAIGTITDNDEDTPAPELIFANGFEGD